MQDGALQNLLLAQRVAAESGDIVGALRIAKYLFRQLEKIDDVYVQITPEGIEQKRQ